VVSLTANAQNLGSLKSVSVPQLSDLNKYVSDQALLIALGKALFWDMQTGSDGRTACATCHFHAGADHRAQNQLANPESPFNLNHRLLVDNFPFRVLADVNDNRSTVLRDTTSIVGSAGLFRRLFREITPGDAFDDGIDTVDAPQFSLNGINVRRVTKRNTSTVINAVFNVRNFWDGRASNIFTGFTPFGDSDTRLNALVLSGDRLVAERVRLDNASLASQAVGPPLNDVEMSYEGRTWPKLGRKILALKPLGLQRVASDDSVLGEFANHDGRGLNPVLTYLTMVQGAFKPEYWNSSHVVDGRGVELSGVISQRSTEQFTQAEFNFALFWGIALQAYQATLVSDNSPFDHRFSEGIADALTSDEQRGLQIFRGQGGCTGNCHVGPEFTSASFSSVNRRGAIRRGGNGANGDTGFFRTGVRPISEDIGLAADDDLGRPMSLAVIERAGARSAVEGAFKTPTLRNVEFTGPYFHNGGQLTLEQVVDFYARGGDFPDGGNLGPGIRRRNLSQADRQSLVAFMKSLTDERIRFERAPFDHPELCVPVGHDEPVSGVLRVDTSDPRFSLSAVDKWAAIPAVGRNGTSVPLQTFEELLLGIGSDGSRAHALADVCTIP
jgi:cytochrome c peroxidase